jgi:hypothetical protein
MKTFRETLALLFAAGSGVKALTDFSTTSGIVKWNNTEWSLTTNKYIPGQYQSRLSLANG